MKNPIVARTNCTVEVFWINSLSSKEDFNFEISLKIKIFPSTIPAYDAKKAGHKIIKAKPPES